MIEVILNATVKSNSLTKTRAVRLRADIASTNIGDVAPETIVMVDKKVIAERDGEFGVGSLKGDIWWHAPAAKVKQDNTPRNGWMAQRHKGEELLSVYLEDEIPEEPVETIVLFGIEIDPENKRLNLRSPSQIDLRQWEISIDGIPYDEASDG